jgi:hypothetical protein
MTNDLDWNIKIIFNSEHLRKHLGLSTHNYRAITKSFFSDTGIVSTNHKKLDSFLNLPLSNFIGGGMYE